MSSDDRRNLLYYYERELTYLRKMGGEFARKYPKVAGRLELSDVECPDPYVERLMEAFAYLTGRIQYNLDQEFPEITNGLLGILYPHYVTPVPSMAIARFVSDPTQGKLTTGYTIPKGSKLYAESHQGYFCRFRTAYPVTLWPLDLVYAGIEPVDNFEFLDSAVDVAAVLRMRLTFRGGTPEDMVVPRLRFHLNGENTLVQAIYELLFRDVSRVAVLSHGGRVPRFLPAGSLAPVGFGADEEVIPFPPHAHWQYRLLQEYFAFPDKFLFFDIENLNVAAGETTFEILMLLDRGPQSRLHIDGSNFLLGCTPIVNLFTKTTEPIRLSQRQVEYLLVPDMRRETSTEIHSILSVSASADAKDDTMHIEPFYSFCHQSDRRASRAFWHARRIATERNGMAGTDMLLSIVDLDFSPSDPPAQTIHAHTFCTNRHLAEQLPSGAKLVIEEAAPVAQIYCINKPTRQIDPPLAGRAYWRLISHLSLNHLSLSDGPSSLTALHEILNLYNIYEDSSRHRQIMEIRDMSTRQTVLRVGDEAWRGFCKGTEITLVFDDDLYADSSSFLLASVLNRFFALYASVNSFTQLVAKSYQQEGIWKKWPPMVGDRMVL